MGGVSRVLFSSYFHYFLRTITGNEHDMIFLSRSLQVPPSYGCIHGETSRNWFLQDLTSPFRIGSHTEEYSLRETTHILHQRILCSRPDRYLSMHQFCIATVTLEFHCLCFYFSGSNARLPKGHPRRQWFLNDRSLRISLIASK